MKKLTHVEFTYEDGSVEEIADPRGCLLFQSRINSSVALAAMDQWLVTKKKASYLKTILSRFRKGDN